MCHVVVTAFDQNVGAHLANDLDRRVFVKPGHQADRLLAGHDDGAVGLIVERPVIALAQAPHRGIGIERHDQAAAQVTGLCQIHDVAAVNHVENAIREYPRFGKMAQSLGSGVTADDLGQKGRGWSWRLAWPQCYQAAFPLKTCLLWSI